MKILLPVDGSELSLKAVRLAVDLLRQGLSGTLRVSAPVTYGEMLIGPLLHGFRNAHPDLTIDLRLSDRFVDLAAEGIDLAIRIGRLDSSALMARKLSEIRLLLVASPSYLADHGTPGRLADLPVHRCIRDTNLRGDGNWPLTEEGVLHRVGVTGHFLINSARLARDLALRGEGIALCPDYAVRDDLRSGKLTHVLPQVCGPGLAGPSGRPSWRGGWFGVGRLQTGWRTP